MREKLTQAALVSQMYGSLKFKGRRVDFVGARINTGLAGLGVSGKVMVSQDLM